MSWKPFRKISHAITLRKLQGYSLAYRKLPWLIGDAINESEDRTVSARIDELRFSAAQLYDFARVAALWREGERMNYELPWVYFRDAGSDKAIAIPVLKKAIELGWSRDTVRLAVRKLREGERV